MKICVVSGSPKGKYSITLQTSLYLQKKNPEHSFTFVNAGQKIRTYEKDMSEVIATLNDAELILFSYPVYTFLVPSQLHRFIELMKESNVDFSDKFVTQISTSKHFYDVTAHQFIEDNCFDMNMKVIHGLSADMEDLTHEQGQIEAQKFLEYVEYCVNQNIYEKPQSIESQSTPTYTKELKVTDKKSDKDVVIVTDLRENDTNLRDMIEDFQNVFDYNTRVINIAEYSLAGGCLGCFHCVGDGKCIYKDKFDDFLRENIQTADAIVYAFTIKDHSMGSRFKMYDDRQFCNGHRTVTEGMPFGYIVNGDYSLEKNLQMVVEARCEVGHNFLAGVGTDVASIMNMSHRLTYSLEHHYVQPRNFYGIGGMKIFRDMIWLMRGLMKADHQFYKSHGAYDFPQKKRGQMIMMCFLGAMVRNPKIRAKMGNKMNEGMVAPYKKVIDKVK